MGADVSDEAGDPTSPDGEVGVDPTASRGPVTFTFSESSDGEQETTDEDDSALSRVLGPLGELAASDPDRLNQIFTDRLAKSIIILVPVFALLLRLLYWKIPYIKQLVFSLHLHSFAFIAILLGIGVDTATGGDVGQGWGNLGATLALLAYTFIALRRVYGQGRMLTGLKLVLLLVGYLISLVLTMMLTLILTAFTI
jgi:hypothetical protein